jgi:hypothetical protein
MKPLDKKVKVKIVKAKLFKSEAHFSVRQMIIFSLIFAGLGTYLIWRSFAATPIVAVIEAEQLTPLPAGASIISDTSASGGQAAKFTAAGAATGSFSTQTTAVVLKVNAKSIQCNGAPQMVIKIDDVQVGPAISVTSSGWAEYQASLNLAGGTHSLSVGPATGSLPYSQTIGNSGKLRCQRALFVDKLTLLGAADTPVTAIEVAKGKPATASSISADGYGRVLQPWYANDGSNTVTSDGTTPSRWASSSADNQWWQVDLGVNTSINRVDVNWETAYASHYKVQGSTDGTTFTDLADVFLTTAGVKSSTFADVSVRYVRIYGLTRGTQWGFSIWEAQVFSGSTTTNPTPLTAAMKLPTNGSTVSGGIPVEATATGPNGVAKVEFYLDGVLNKTETVAPYCMASDPNSSPCYNWDSTTVPNGSHTITAYAYDAAGAKSPASTVTFTVANTTSGGGTSTGVGPSGVPMPVGDITSNGHTWRQIFTDDFTTNVPLGSFPSAVSSKWSAYNDTWLDTYKTGMYYPSKVVSIQNGVLNKYLHDENINGTNRRLVAAILPKIVNGQTNQLYGRYVIRFKTDSLPNYYAAWLLWPQSENWPHDGEVDFPEGKLSGSMGGYIHRQDACDTCGGDQTAFSTGILFAPAWHTAVIEWSPGKIFLQMDNWTGTSTDRIPNTPMHWVIQTETGTAPDGITDGNLQIDWVAAYAY